jgi:molybdenum cofactor biosynthesis protein B
MGETTEKHKGQAPSRVRAAVVTISDSKYDYLWSKRGDLEETEDISGKSIIDALEKAGHDVVFYTIIPDHAGVIVETVDHIIATYALDIIITTGGTGIASKDVTVEALVGVLDKVIEGFGELFRKMSFDRLGSAALLTRAIAGVWNGVVIFSLPGSPDAVQTGMEIILKEVGHLVKHARE